jgi:hypothetical protein
MLPARGGWPALKPTVQEKHNGNGLIAKLGSLFNCLFYACAPMLAIIDQEPCRHRYDINFL